MVNPMKWSTFKSHWTQRTSFLYQRAWLLISYYPGTLLWFHSHYCHDCKTSSLCDCVRSKPWRDWMQTLNGWFWCWSFPVSHPSVDLTWTRNCYISSKWVYLKKVYIVKSFPPIQPICFSLWQISSRKRS